MTNIEQQKRIANYMAALAHLLGGQSGNFTEFLGKVDIMLGGSAPYDLALMQFSNRVQATGRPLIWVYLPAENPGVPRIGLVVQIDGGMHYVENCMLLLGKGDDRASLAPDSFNLGAYRFNDEFMLKHSFDALASTFEEENADMVRAYKRLIAIETEQWERGDVFELPCVAKAA